MRADTTPVTPLPVRYDLPRGVNRSAQLVHGRYVYCAVSHTGRVMEIWRPRMGETDEEIISALAILTDLLDAPVSPSASAHRRTA